MNDLERHYRDGLRFYTAGWRRKNGDALVSTLIDGAEAEQRTQPTATELRDLTRTGLRQRAGALVPFVFFAIALCSLVTLVVFTATGFGTTNGLGGAVAKLPNLPVHAYVAYTFPAPPHTSFPPALPYIAATVLLITCAAVGVVTLWRNRRLLSD